ncbi:caspase family protein [uncultured Shimia sp.]|uniref:caspase family protein n=1 Tax=uncultured Shimia sp. TaxID=573152 RepID=UPI0026136D37|nr:caspase family protein [uncultured Shimia sp.]
MRALFLSIACVLGLTASGRAEPRVALVIGNAVYSDVTPLANAGADAALISAALSEVGFSVTVVSNGTQNEMKRAIAKFGAALRAAGPDAVGLFYYAGHGIQSFGANYLLPVDARLTVAADLDLVGLEAASVLRQMASAANRTNIVILDACRDNPFEHVPDINDSGLAEMKAPTGTFLAYATAPGQVAFDGAGDNSPFSKALARELLVPGAPVEQVFKQVRVSVLSETNGQQTPWDTSSLTQEFVFKASVPMLAEGVAEAQLWQTVEESRDPVQIMLFMRTHPNGQFIEDARRLLATTLEMELNQSRAEPTEPMASMPAPKEVEDEETALMERARKSGDIADFEAYLEVFPTGVFAELVKKEVAALHSSGASNPPTLSDGGDDVTQPIGLEAMDWDVAFDAPLEIGPPELIGLTLLEATAISPLFPPIEGLPDEMWKHQTCGNCHNWTRTALCDQGKFYQKQAAVRHLEKNHPFGGDFKRNLKNWARGDCQ